MPQLAARATTPALALPVVSLGFSAFLTQVVLMRELASVLAGNELVFGIVLGVWLLMTGLGSWWGASASRLRHGLEIFLIGQAGIALWPIVGAVLVRTLRNVVFIRGAAVGISETVLFCLATLGPYCLLTGYLLTLASQILPARHEPAGIGAVYGLDSAGGVLAGFGFSWVLVHWLDHFRILTLAAGLVMGTALAAAVCNRRRGIALGAGMLLVVLAGAGVGWDLDRLTIKSLFAPHEVVYHAQSPYGSLVVTRSARQYNFFQNGVPLFSTQNPEAAEETVHYAMAQRPWAKRVLLISGGVSGTAQEILKYAAQVDYVEVDPLVVEVARRFVPEALADPRIEVLPTDGRRFVRQTDRRYDVIIMDVPDPSTSQLNRFYTREFFAEAKRCLNPDGVLAFGLGRYENRIAGPLARLVAVAHRTLSAEFAHVLVIPGSRLRFLASDSPLTTAITQRLQEYKIPVRLLDPSYVADRLRPDRRADVERALSPAPLNRDFSPILYYHQLGYWISQFGTGLGVVASLVLLVLAGLALRLRAVSVAVFAAGFGASALEVILLVGFQILYGSLYQQVGMIVTVFMLGLALGSLVMSRLLPGCTRRDLVLLELGLAAWAAGVPGVLFGLSALGGVSWAGRAGPWAIYAVTLGLAMLVGSVFSLAAKLDFHGAATTASRLYTADYLGAALGALLVSTMLVPLIGVVAVCLITAALNVLGGVMAGLGRSK